MITASDILRKASERTREDGKWYQGWLWPLVWTAEEASKQDLPACANGQLRIINYRLTGKDEGAALLGAHRALDALRPDGYATTPKWNDDPSRTQDEVADMLLRAADIEDGLL